MENVLRILDRIEDLGHDLNNIISINLSSSLLNENLEYIAEDETHLLLDQINEIN